MSSFNEPCSYGTYSRHEPIHMVNRVSSYFPKGGQYTNITNSQNTKRTYSQPSARQFRERWPHSNRNRTKNMNTHKVKHHRNSDTKKQVTENQTTALERSVMKILWVGGALTSFTCTTSPSVSEVVKKNISFLVRFT